MIMLMHPPATPIPPSDILIVDDTINNVKLLSDMLTQAGFSVRKAISGQMALMAIAANKPDLILLDVNMPEMNGYEVCEQLKHDPNTQAIPVIFLSASDITADKVKAFAVGGSDYVTKPFYAEEVIARIQHQLLLSQLRSELTAKNQALEETLAQLKAAQVELIQQQKMLGLSQLMAGMAHEINNPINFIAGNLKPASQYFSEVLALLNLYRQHYPNPGEIIANAIADAELDFITQDFANLIQSMQAGSDRIAKLVQALQTFSHHGEAPIKPTDLHTTFDSIITILKPQLQAQNQRPPITVTCQYGQLPLVTCNPRLISQTLLHILENAIAAIDARWASDSLSSDDRPAPPEIVITTDSPSLDWVTLSIRDNGIGIPEAIQAQIFDPFFTTKPVGQGNGLGLAISYQTIVTQHQGKITLTSAPGNGVEFTIQLPVAMELSTEGDLNPYGALGCG